MKRILSLMLAVIMVIMIPVSVQAKGPKTFVKKLVLSESSVKMETFGDEEVEAVVKVKGKADTGITAVSSDEEICTVYVEAEEEDPGLSYIVIESGEKTGETTIKVTTVGTNKKKKAISKTIKVTVVEAPANGGK